MSLACEEVFCGASSPQRPGTAPSPMQDDSPEPADRLPDQLDDFHLQQLSAMLQTELRQWRGDPHLQPELASEHRFFLVQWLHAVSSLRILHAHATARARAEKRAHASTPVASRVTQRWQRC